MLIVAACQCVKPVGWQLLQQLLRGPLLWCLKHYSSMLILQNLTLFHTNCSTRISSSLISAPFRDLQFPMEAETRMPYPRWWGQLHYPFGCGCTCPLRYSLAQLGVFYDTLKDLWAGGLGPDFEIQPKVSVLRKLWLIPFLPILHTKKENGREELANTAQGMVTEITFLLVTVWH